MKRACAGCGAVIDVGGPIRCPDCASRKPTRNHKLHKRFARAVVERALGAPDAYSPSSGVTVTA